MIRMPAELGCALGTGTIIWLVIAAAAAILLPVGIHRVRRAYRNSLAGQLFTALRQAKPMLEAKQFEPRSLNGMESVYGPQIARDFPNLQIDALGNAAETLLLKSYAALDKGEVEPALAAEVGPLYAEALERLISQHRSQGERAPVFSAVLVHRRVLSYYGRRNGKRTIEFQFAVEAQVTNRRGSQKQRRQMRDAIRYSYLEDVKKFRDADTEQKVLTRNCPNCGAPLKGRNEEICPYCGSTVKSMELEVWLPDELMPECWLEDYYARTPEGNLID